MAAWEKEISTNQPDWIVLGDLEQEGDKSQRYEYLKDGSLLACGYAPTKFTQWFRVTNDLTAITAFRLVQEQMARVREETERWRGMREKMRALLE